MATYYALPGLTTWDGSYRANAWSTTSGGAAITSGAPGSNDTAIFDANSGAARTISVNAAIGSVNTAGSSGLTFSGTLNVYGLTANLSALVSGPSTLGFMNYYNGGTNFCMFTPPSATIGTVTVRASVELGGNLDCNYLDLDVYSDGTTHYPINFRANNRNVTVNTRFRFVNSGHSSVIYFGSGTWTLKGGGDASNYVIYSNGWSAYAEGVKVVLDMPSTANKFLWWPSRSDTAYPSFHFKATSSGGSGQLNIQNPASFINELKIDPACRVEIPDSLVIRANTYAIAGTANTPVQLYKGSGTDYGHLEFHAGAPDRQFIDYATVTQINSSPVGKLLARACTLDRSNIKVYSAGPNFSTFF